METSPDNAREDAESAFFSEVVTDFIDWEKRREGENGFLTKTLHRFQCKTVFDASLGDGVDSIYLLKEGFDVTSNDLDPKMIEIAKKNFVKQGLTPKITQYDWRELNSFFEKGIFDAVICLGNSLTMLHSEHDQKRALAGFYHLLRKGGVLIIDERNYPYLLNKRDEIAKMGKFRYSGKYVYCGTRIKAFPVQISNDNVHMEYTDVKTGKKAFLDLYPFKEGELVQLLKGIGFQTIEGYSDYQPGSNNGADFFQYVCIK